MKITAVVENQEGSALKAVHGLSLYIETAEHKILFDLGPDDTLVENCAKLGIDLAGVDIAIISHGHNDHGGALGRFLEINHTAKIYVQRAAFDNYYVKTMGETDSIGLAPELKTHPQVVLLDGDYSISADMKLFVTPNTSKCWSTANDVLYDESGRDRFAHEHNLAILGETTVLFIGCGHAGVVNILERAAEFSPRACVGGYHLWNPRKKETVPEELLHGISNELRKHDIRFYTCHCTGHEAFDYLHERVANMNYMRCGDTIEL